MTYLWTKTFHALFVIAWMACVFYLPRILVNLAETRGQPAVQERIALMGTRLYRFGHAMFAVMLVLGLLLWFGRFLAPSLWPNVTAGSGWMHAKFLLVLLLLAYFIVTGKMLKSMAAGGPAKSSGWYRWFNEVPLLLAIPVLFLVIAKPF
jgi:putative membrane protein